MVPSGSGLRPSEYHPNNLVRNSTDKLKDRRPTAVHPTPNNKLMLADNDIYLANELTFYQILRHYGQIYYRGRSHAPITISKPNSHYPLLRPVRSFSQKIVGNKVYEGGNG